MLTLAPGEVGGSETYARELARALAARGRVHVTAVVSDAAPNAGDGLPTAVIGEYPVARTRRGRLAVRVLVAARSGRVGRRIASRNFAAAHFPLTTVVPRLDVPTAVTLHDTLHHDFPRLFGRAE